MKTLGTTVHNHKYNSSIFHVPGGVKHKSGCGSPPPSVLHHRWTFLAPVLETKCQSLDEMVAGKMSSVTNLWPSLVRLDLGGDSGTDEKMFCPRSHCLTVLVHGGSGKDVEWTRRQLSFSVIVLW